MINCKNSKKGNHCEDCNKEFKREDIMLKFRRKSYKKGRELQETSYTWKKCGKAFDRNANLIRHQATHGAKTKYVSINNQKLYTRKGHFQNYQCFETEVYVKDNRIKLEGLSQLSIAYQDQVRYRSWVI